MTRNGIVGGDIAMRGLLKFQMLLYRPGKERRAVLQGAVP